MMVRRCLLTCALLAACGDEVTDLDGDGYDTEDDARCAAIVAGPDGSIGEIDSRPLTEPVTAALVVRGSIDVPANVTIRRLLVNDVEVSSSSVNFATWTTTIPIEVLAALPRDADGRVTLTALAYTNCRTTPFVAGTSTFRVDTTGLAVSELELSVTPPNGQTYVPLSPAVPAQLTVRANREAVGATAVFTAKAATSVAPAQLELRAGIDGKAVAFATFTPTTAGTEIVSVKVKDWSRSVAIRVAGPPRFTPAGETIVAGNTLRVTVLTDGKVSYCEATDQPGMRVTSGPGTNLMTGTGGVDLTSDGLVDLDVSVDLDAAVTAGTQTTITCRDPHGQAASATFRASARITPPPPVVTSLAVSATIPAGRLYLPTSEPVSALITVQGNPQAAGAPVTLTTTQGTLTASPLILAGNGTGNTFAYAFFSSTVAGHAVITATAPGHTASTVIELVGRPTFGPAGGALAAGATQPVLVTGGLGTRCQATPSASFQVRSGTADLMAAPGGTQNGDGVISLVVTVAPMLAAPAQTTITCTDPHGQVGTATFTAAPQ